MNPIPFERCHVFPESVNSGTVGDGKMFWQKLEWLLTKYFQRCLKKHVVRHVYLISYNYYSYNKNYRIFFIPIKGRCERTSSQQRVSILVTRIPPPDPLAFHCNVISYFGDNDTYTRYLSSPSFLSKPNEWINRSKEKRDRIIDRRGLSLNK